MAIVAGVVRMKSPGPIIYRAERIGIAGSLFTIHKFRTMDAACEPGSVITATVDPRVFPAGRWLRRAKLDELPQLWDVFRGAMSLVGPRPEDPSIVRYYYSDSMLKTLEVRPGLTSPGSLFGTTHGDALMGRRDPQSAYVERLLPIKLALEEVYLENWSIWYDLRVIARTIWVIVALTTGRRSFPDPPEMADAMALLDG